MPSPWGAATPHRLSCEPCEGAALFQGGASSAEGTQGATLVQGFPVFAETLAGQAGVDTHRARCQVGCAGRSMHHAVRQARARHGAGTHRPPHQASAQIRAGIQCCWRGMAWPCA